MDTIQKSSYTTLDMDELIWERVHTVAPLVIVGTREKSGYDLAPKHMITPLGFGNYFGFVCTPRHNTYQNIKTTGEFTVSFPRPNQLVTTSLSASPRTKQISKSEGIVEQLAIIRATTMDAPMIQDAYFLLECELHKIVDGFDDYSLITGRVKAAHAHKDYLRVSEQDEQEQLGRFPLLAYIAPGRFATINETYNFPFPRDFKR